MILSTNAEKFDKAFYFTFKNIETKKVDFSSAKRVLEDLFSFLEIEEMTKKEVRRVYHEKVWLENNLDKIEDVRISRKVFDFCCNIGVKRGVILLERSLNSGWGKRIKVDGSIGKKEVQLIDKIDDQGQSDILEKLVCHYAANFYETFGKKKHIKHTLQWIFR